MGSLFIISSRGVLRNSGPSMANPPVDSSRMPQSRAMCCAVWMLSPVTMRTRIPARTHVRTAPVDTQNITLRPRLCGHKTIREVGTTKHCCTCAILNEGHLTWETGFMHKGETVKRTRNLLADGILDADNAADCEVFVGWSAEEICWARWVILGHVVVT